MIDLLALQTIGILMTGVSLNRSSILQSKKHTEESTTTAGHKTGTAIHADL